MYHDCKPLNFGGKCSNFETSFNFVNSLLGAGLIGIPLAIQQCGLVMGVMVMTLVAYLIYKSATMMIACGIQKKVYNLEELSETALGQVGYYVSTIAMFVFACGGQTAYLVIIGDTVPSVAHFFSDDNIFTNRTFCLWIFSTFIILPLCLSRELGHLAWTSLLAIILEVVLLLVIAYASFQHRSSHADSGFQTTDVKDVNASVFAGVGTMSFALVCQHNSFLLFQSLQAPTIENWKQVAALSISAGFLVSLLLGLVGFIAFYPYVDGDILNNFPVNSTVVGVGRSILAATMLFTYPMELYVSRYSLLAILIRWRRYRQLHHINNDRSNSQTSLSTQLPSDEIFSALHPELPDFPSSGIRQGSRDHTQLLSQQRSPSQRKAQYRKKSQRKIMKKKYNRLMQSADENLEGDVDPDAEDGYDFEEVQVLQHDSNSDDDGKNVEMVSFASPLQHPRHVGQTSLDYATPQSFSTSTATSKMLENSRADEFESDELLEEIVFDNGAVADTDTSPASTHLMDMTSTAVTLSGATSTTNSNNDSTNTASHQISLQEHLFWTISIWLATLTIALSARELGVISALTGTVAASTLGYTLPALIFIRCHGAEWKQMMESIHTLLLRMVSHRVAEVGDNIPRQIDEHVPSSTSTAAISTSLQGSVRLFFIPVILFIFGVATFFIGVTTVLISASS